MSSNITLQLTTFFLLMYAVNSFTYQQIDVEDSTLTIPSHICQIKTATFQTTLSHSWLKKICGNIDIMKEIEIRANFCGIETNLFEKLPKVERLQANGLNFSNVFLSSSNLKTIDFSRNEIQEFGLIIYKSLKSLYVPYNKLEEIKLYPVEGEMTNLQLLDLSHNKLKRIDGLSNSYNLKYLDLSYNGIENLQDQDFAKFKKLVFLNLSFNKISSISGCTFCALKKLKVLNLFHNEIKTIDELRIHSLKHLIILDLNQNNLEQLDYRSLLENHPNLKNVKSTNNTWYCRFSTEEESSGSVSCFTVLNSKKMCCSFRKNNRKKRSLSNSHFHATINNRKMFHNTSALGSQRNVTKDQKVMDAITFKEFFEEIHRVNDENVKALLDVVLIRINSGISELNKRSFDILTKIDSDMFVINRKLDEINETMDDMAKEIENLITSNNNNMKSFEENLNDVKYLVKLTIALLLTFILATIFVNLMRLYSKGSHRARKSMIRLSNIDNIEEVKLNLKD